MPAATAGAASGHAVHTVAHSGDRVVRQTGAVDRTTRGRSSTLHVPSTIHLLAARLYWGDAPPSYPSKRHAQHELTRTGDYFERISRGRQTFHTTLTRWVRVNASQAVMCSKQAASAEAATAALRRAGYHPGRYNRLMLLTEQCNAAVSAAQLPGPVSWIRFRAPGVPTLAHELGHNMGLEHAYGLVCRESGHRVSLGGHCRRVEYGDSWDVMGHSRASYSVPVLARLGWAGRIATARTSGEYQLADVERSGVAIQGLRIPVGDHTTYWVENQPEHSVQVGRSIPGVMIRRQVGNGPIEIVDSSPGNPAGIAFPDRDLTNPALPAGSSVTTPEHVRITTLLSGRTATVRVTFGSQADVPDAPTVDFAARTEDGDYLVRWQAPPDNGQIVLGYRITDHASGTETYVRSPAAYRTSVSVPVDRGGPVPVFTVRALNQVGWSPLSTEVVGTAYGPDVTVTSPTARAHLRTTFVVRLTATPDPETHAAPTRAWAEASGVPCTTSRGPGPYVLTCSKVPHGRATLAVHVRNAAGATTDVKVPIKVRGGSPHGS